MYIGNPVKCQLFSLGCNKNEILLTIFEKCSNIKFHVNPFSGSTDVPCAVSDRHIPTCVTKLIVACRYFMNDPKNLSKRNWSRFEPVFSRIQRKLAKKRVYTQ
jgi:hypothetical protein